MDGTFMDLADSNDEILVNSDQVEVIKNIKRLTAKMNSIVVEPETLKHSSLELKGILDESNTLALSAYNASSAALHDSDLISASSRTVSKMTRVLEMDTRNFQTASFTTHVKKVLNLPAPKAPRRADLSKLAQRHTRISSILGYRAPTIKYTFGSLDFDCEEKKTQPGENSQKVAYEGKPAAKKPRTTLTISDVKQSAQIINAKTAKEKVEKDRTVVEVEKLHERLSNMSESNDGDHIPYLTLVVDPEDFGKTVENIFHCSFLIKEGYAEIRVIERSGGRLTVVKAVPGEERERNDRQRSSAQVAITVTEKLWHEWCDKIQRPPYLL